MAFVDRSINSGFAEPQNKKKVFVNVDGETVERAIVGGRLYLTSLRDGDKITLLSRRLAQSVLVTLKVHKSESHRVRYCNDTLYEFVEAMADGQLTRAAFATAPSVPYNRVFEQAANFGVF